MEFAFSPRHEEIRTVARRVRETVIAPRAAVIDATGEYPHDIFAALQEAGLFGLIFPREYGGSGDGTLGMAVAIEEVARACCSSGLLLLLARLATIHIEIAGTEEQKARYLRGVATGQMKGAFGISEPEVGSDSGAIRTAAIRDGDAYILTGRKKWAGQATEADFVVVSARIGGEGSKEIGIFIVPSDAAGFRVVRKMPKMGVRAVPVCEIELAECRVSVMNRVGPERGFRTLLQGLSMVRPLVAARALGLAAGILDYATDYARDRQTMGQPIIQHEAIGFRLAERAMELEAARLLTYRACWLVDQGRTTGADAAHFSMAKAYATEMSVRAADTALQTLGGNGYLVEYPTERFYRDARQFLLVEGTSEIQRLIISRAIQIGDYQW